jgi:phthalate 4,5-dioxygenase oxygenase subunit
MLSAAQNERITRVGSGTPMGEVFRRYWLPALMSSELHENDGPPVRVRLLGEDLVAFRDSEGNVGLVSAFCPHRRAPLFFGRNEESGLRCVYHGWKFDRTGSCVDMPSEPADSLFKTKVRVESYPTWEGGGLVWAYLGPVAATPPPPPNYELVRVPATHRFVSKTFEDCNYLQAQEGGVDSSHSSILHTSRGSDVSFLKNYEAIVPRIEVRKTDYGIVYSGIRTHQDQQWVRVSQFVMPSMHIRGTIQSVFRKDIQQPTMDGHLWVPIDDEHTWVYNYTYSYFPETPLPREYALAIEVAQGRGPDDVGPDFHSRWNRSNEYGLDRSAQKNGSFTGIKGINTQDFALQENMETIVDRTKEHLSAIDQPIIVMRSLLLEAADDVAAGRVPRGALPQTHENVRAADDFLPPGIDWEEGLKENLLALY